MFIIELTMFESEFIEKSKEITGSYLIRTFDIDHQVSVFAYYYEDDIHIKLNRYNSKATSLLDWKFLKNFRNIFEDVYLEEPLKVSIDHKKNQLNIYLAHNKVKRNDK